jgi:NDP-sugar pyrophosphorylase family protein
VARVVEAIILAGGKAERLGDAAAGRPKALVPVAGKPLAAHQLELLAAAGVERVVLSCAAGRGAEFEVLLRGLAPEVVAAEEPEPLGRGGGLRFAARARLGRGSCFVLNGDELVDLDLGQLADRHEASGAAATIVVARPTSPYGVVEIEGDLVRGFREAARLDQWVSCGVYVFSAEAFDRLPERGDHETTTFPELALEGRLGAQRHEGLWLTVNTPKDLRVADEQLTARGGSLAGDA